MCVLPVPGGPYSSRPRLTCWPAASNAAAVRADPDGVTLDRGQIVLGDDHLGACHGFDLRERHPELAVAPERERHDLAAHDVVRLHRRVQGLDEPAERPRISGDDLDPHLRHRPALLAQVRQHRHRPAAVLGQHEPGAQARQRSIGADVDVDIGAGARLAGAVPVPRGHPGEGEAAVVADVRRQAQDLERRRRRGELVERQLDVGVLHHRHGAAAASSACAGPDRARATPCRRVAPRHGRQRSLALWSARHRTGHRARHRAPVELDECGGDRLAREAGARPRPT